ncbi:MAG: tetratricopeptide repeat protein [Sphingobacteriales bacterium]|nr:tetratricopeptide repeat protein [Sphingobacteriales bacterium]OJY85722.1 MAG: hypothetical protein BGP14_17390 [Sphingobacteriales bacterium 44-15]
MKRVKNIVSTGTTALIIFLLLAGAEHAYAQKSNTLIGKGNEFYRQQEYDKARAAYEEALAKEPGNATASFNMGNTLFREKKFEEAAKTFEEAAQKTKDKTVQSQLYYNKGVALTQQKQLEQSIEAYKQSLRFNPADSLARDNLQRALNEKKQQEQQQQQEQQKKQDKKDQPPPPKQNKLNQQQVQQLLKALEEQEKKLQEKMMKKPPVAGQPDKDW